MLKTDIQQNAMPLVNQTQSVSNTSYYAWVVISLCACILFYKYLLSVFPSSMTDNLMQTFHITGVGLGNIGAAFYYTYTITQLFVGVLLDRYSVRWLATASILVSALGALLFAHAQVLTVALIARGLMGLGAAFATVTYLKIASMWFRANQLAFVSGLLATAVMVGAVCGVAPLTILISAIGWRSTILVLAVIGCVIACLFFIFVRESDHLTEAYTPTIKGISSIDILSVIRNPQNWLLTCYNGLAFVPLTIFAGLWGNPFLRTLYPISVSQAGWLLSLVFIGLGTGAPLFGLLSDYLKQRRMVMFLGLALSLVSVSIVVYVPGLSIFVLAFLLFLFGFGTGAFMLVFSVGRQLNSLKLAGTVIALINTGELLNSITEPLIGKFLDLQWSGDQIKAIHIFSIADYQSAFSVLPIYLILGMIVLYFIREPKEY